MGTLCTFGQLGGSPVTQMCTWLSMSQITLASCKVGGECFYECERESSPVVGFGDDGLVVIMS